MGNMWRAMMLVFALEVAMLIFPQGTYNSTPVYGLVTNLSLWSNTGLLGFILPLLATLGAGATIIGTFFSNVDWVFRATMAATFITFGSSLLHVFMYIAGTGLFGDASTLMAAILMVVLVMFYLGNSIDFISGRD